MMAFLKKYSGFLIGLAILLVLTQILSSLKLILIDPDEWLTNTLFFVFWWLVFSFPIYKYKYILQHKLVAYKVLGLSVCLILMVVIDSYFNIPDNPGTIFLLVTLWLGLFYLFIPKFFTKYQRYIIGVYAIILLYFFYVRLSAISFEDYVSNDKETAFALFFLPIPFLILVWVYDQWKWLKTLKADKSKAELELLKTQINPHFFFNTLNNLYSLTVKHSDKAPEVILKLSEMMRYTIYEGKKEFVPLREEVTYLENYIELHKIRYQKKVNIEFSHSIENEDQVAPLLFIILLENALKHGVESLTDSAYVKIDLSSSNRHIRFSIENNYEPLEINESKGIGLENLKRRLELIYPKTHELNIHKTASTFAVDLKISHQ
ncbi:sensor histidine kinase [Roseivirga seohaensis]|uniref:sensor histidine kinase n=1 Tax=Roseivirga seohaensis TaxID=1914963 RepID=UPI003BAD6F48